MLVEKCCLDCKYFTGVEGITGYEKAKGSRYCTWSEENDIPMALDVHLDESIEKASVEEILFFIDSKRPFTGCSCWEEKENPQC